MQRNLVFTAFLFTNISLLDNVFIAFDPNPEDSFRAEELQKKLLEKELTCILRFVLTIEDNNISKNVNVSQLSQSVMSCGYLVYLISRKSLESSKVS